MKTSVDIKITINPAPPPPPPPPSDLTVDFSHVPTSGEVGQPFSGELDVAGGNPPYGFVVLSGSLPDGVSLLSDGSFSGTPTVAGDFAFTIGVTDANG